MMMTMQQPDSDNSSSDAEDAPDGFDLPFRPHYSFDLFDGPMKDSDKDAILDNLQRGLCFIKEKSDLGYLRCTRSPDMFPDSIKIKEASATDDETVVVWDWEKQELSSFSYDDIKEFRPIPPWDEDEGIWSPETQTEFKKAVASINLPEAYSLEVIPRYHEDPIAHLEFCHEYDITSFHGGGRLGWWGSLSTYIRGARILLLRNHHPVDIFDNIDELIECEPDLIDKGQNGEEGDEEETRQRLILLKEIKYHEQLHHHIEQAFDWVRRQESNRMESAFNDALQMVGKKLQELKEQEEKADNSE